MSMETNLIPSQMQRDTENACVNMMWKLGLSCEKDRAPYEDAHGEDQWFSTGEP